LRRCNDESIEFGWSEGFEHLAVEKMDGVAKIFGRRNNGRREKKG
jgi:hypothetical protein